MLGVLPPKQPKNKKTKKVAGEVDGKGNAQEIYQGLHKVLSELAVVDVLSIESTCKYVTFLDLNYMFKIGNFED